jgi:uncharacterized protein
LEADVGTRDPELTLDNEFFWTGVAAGQLLAQQCDRCGEFRHPPSPRCPHCLAPEWTARELADTAELYTYTVVHHPVPKGFTAPYVVALLQWPNGVRLLTNVVDVDPADVSIGMQVRLTPTEVEPGVVLPIGRPLRKDSDA